MADEVESYPHPELTTPGCCSSCDGTGCGGDAQSNGLCYDCRGTGHSHGWDGMVLVLGVGCMTTLESQILAAELGVVPTRWVMGMPPA